VRNDAPQAHRANRIDELAQPDLLGAALGLAHLPRRTQVRHQFLLQHAGCLDKEASAGFFFGAT